MMYACLLLIGEAIWCLHDYWSGYLPIKMACLSCACVQVYLHFYICSLNNYLIFSTNWLPHSNIVESSLIVD